jgi:hypothetical protein
MFLEHKEATEITEAPAKTLKLSEAIRIGARIRPKCTSALFDEGRSCALGAAYEAVYGYPGDGHYGFPAMDGRLGLRFGEALSRAFPALYDSQRYLLHEVFAHNDFHEWTREQIADWLEAQGY